MALEAHQRRSAWSACSAPDDASSRGPSRLRRAETVPTGKQARLLAGERTLSGYVHVTDDAARAQLLGRAHELHVNIRRIEETAADFPGALAILRPVAGCGRVHATIVRAVGRHAEGPAEAAQLRRRADVVAAGLFAGRSSVGARSRAWCSVLRAFPEKARTAGTGSAALPAVRCVPLYVDAAVRTARLSLRAGAYPAHALLVERTRPVTGAAVEIVLLHVDATVMTAQVSLRAGLACPAQTLLVGRTRPATDATVLAVRLRIQADRATERHAGVADTASVRAHHPERAAIVVAFPAMLPRAL
jgi:hypothetical protein